ncbi:hypothetical protein UP10_10315 [Bradyrhizobium sp. LTSPM299]|uniref:hypothetical protein n=1 Tax=Bradyrhizobium sp. LTSPM299 TaxID=1619233 RepID=UPI0005C882C6|nr:hypothetical protein [Bradyrhizobium sp. LTSPM299]KJC61245.1 hypothetical protein UP10_10315 [Bradyrhizobium sp. LTSPM299]
MKAHTEDKASTESPEPSKVLEAFSFVLLAAVGVALVAFFGIKIGDIGVLASKLALVVAFAAAWIAKAVRITLTRILLPFSMLFVVVRDDKIVGVQFWAVGALIAVFAALFVLE